MVAVKFSSRRLLILAVIIVVTILVLVYYGNWRRHAGHLICPETSVGIFEEHPSKNLKKLPGKYFLVVLILSRPSDTERRNAIRQSWMNSNYHLLQSQAVLVRFSIGLKEASKAVLRELNEEQSINNDLLFLDEFEESYSNLTLKVLESFIAIHKHYSFSYILKCDDDSFVVLDIIVKELYRRNSSKSYYWGKMIEGAKVFKVGKFAETKWNLGKKYIPYAIGGGYILSGNLIDIVVRNSDDVMLYRNEDVAVSVWISPYNVERQNDTRVCENKRHMFNLCKKNAVIIHPVHSPEDMTSFQTLYGNNPS